jgi:hypothetical protein
MIFLILIIAMFRWSSSIFFLQGVEEGLASTLDDDYVERVVSRYDDYTVFLVNGKPVRSQMKICTWTIM